MLQFNVYCITKAKKEDKKIKLIQIKKRKFRMIDFI